MTPSELVSRLLAAIQEREDVANEAEQMGLGGEWFSVVAAGSGDASVESRTALVVPPPNWIEFNRHIAANDPKSVLRLCQAHRKIIDQYQAAKALPEQLLAQRAHGDKYLEAMAVFKALHAVIVSVAEGYGVEATP